MRKTIVVAAALAAVLPASGAFSQDAERYRLDKTESGYVRMDSKTGEISLCKERSGQLVCTVAADERSAYQEDIESLRKRVDDLEARIAALESGDTSSELPSNEEFEQTMGMMERFFRRFMGVIQDMEKDFGTGEPEQPAPDRT